MEEMSHVFLFAFFFTAAHFHLVGRQHFSFSHCPNKIFMFFFLRNWLPLFVSRSSSCSVINIKVDIEIQSKERLKGDSASLLSFSLPKSQGGHAIYQRNARVFDMRNFTPFLHKGVDVRSDDFLRNKISRMHR